MKIIFRSILFLFLLAPVIVNAEVVDPTFTFNGFSVSNANFITAGVGNRYFSVDYKGFPSGLPSPSDYWYVTIAVCADHPSLTYSHTGGSGQKEIGVTRTQYSCFYPDSTYTGGKVYIINYKQAGGGSYNSFGLTWYMDESTSLTIIDFNVSLQGYVDNSKYANISSYMEQQKITESLNNLNSSLNVNF